MRRVVAALAACCCLYAAGARSDPREACRVGVQLHLRSHGSPEESYLRHVRAFVEKGMCDYALLVASSLKDDELDQVIGYLKDHDVYFLIQEDIAVFKDDRRDRDYSFAVTRPA